MISENIFLLLGFKLLLRLSGDNNGSMNNGMEGRRNTEKVLKKRKR